MLLAAVALTAVSFAAPCLRFSFLYDDFDFLRSAQSFRASDLIPHEGSLFYRPLSREIWFGLFRSTQLAHPWTLHGINIVLIAVGAALLASFVRRVAGIRAGVIAGFLFAGFGAMPILVWASGVQDLLAIDLVIASLWLRSCGRDALALVAFAGAILSKETAVAILPILALQPWLLERRRIPVREALAYLVIVALWSAIHPGVRILFARGFAPVPGGYLGVEPGLHLGALLRSVATLSNVPTASVEWKFIDGRWISLAVAGGLVWAGLRRTPASDPREEDHHRILVFAGLIAALPLALTLLLVRFWAPYYMCLPAVGTSIGIAVLLRNAPWRRSAIIVIVFLTLGVLARAARMDPEVTSERSFERTSESLLRVERGFKQLRPELPAGSSLYVSAQVQAVEGVYTHLYRFQALSVWYEDPTLHTSKPQEMANRSGPEFLFWLEPSLDVGEIEVSSLRPRSSGERPSYTRYQKTLRLYAIGLAASGASARGARVLLRMPEPNEMIRGLDARIASMLLLVGGEEAGARELLARVPPVSREDALATLSGVLASVPRGLNWDDAALRAFGIPGEDLDAARILMRWFLAYGYDVPAERFASRILRHSTGDPEAAAALLRLSNKRTPDIIIGE